jgi:Asp/Glu/hydantoin racemase
MKLIYHSLGNLNNLSGYAGAMRSYLDEVSRPDTEFELHGTPKGGVADTYRYFALQDAHGVSTTIAQEKDRVDGIAIGNILDPSLREGREISSIPILGLGETSYLVACSVAETAAVAPLNPKWESNIRDRIRMYGLEDRVPIVRGMDIPLDKMGAAFDDDEKRQYVLNAVSDIVESVAADGAEIVIPGGGIISMLLNQEGITEMHGVPIMDQITVLVKLTETYVDLYQIGALKTSEKGMYAPPEKEFLGELLSLYNLDD